eukprot:m.8345 g.8345  ORF g.8345 m.8345 type:complete len:94 (+) comp20517_c1_seq1:163-444(+)
MNRKSISATALKSSPLLVASDAMRQSQGQRIQLSITTCMLLVFRLNYGFFKGNVAKGTSVGNKKSDLLKGQPIKMLLWRLHQSKHIFFCLVPI